MKRFLCILLAMALLLGMLPLTALAAKEEHEEIQQIAVNTIVTYEDGDEELRIYRYITQGKRALWHGYYNRFEVVMIRGGEEKRYETKTWWTTYEAMTLEKAARKDEQLEKIMPAVRKAVSDIQLKQAFEELVRNPDAAVFLSEQWMQDVKNWQKELMLETIDGFCMDVIGVGLSANQLRSALYDVGREAYQAIENSQQDETMADTIMDREWIRNLLWALEFFLGFTRYITADRMKLENPFEKHYVENIVAMHDATREIVQ